MANIPRYFARELPPAGVARAGVPAGWNSLLATDISESGKEFAAMGQKMQDAQNVSDHNSALSQATIALTEMTDKYRDDTDYKTMNERAVEEIKDLRGNILGVIGDSQTASLVGMKFDQMAAMELSDIRGFQRKGVITEGQANTMASLDAYMDAYVKADSPQKRAIFAGMIEGTLQGYEAAGFGDSADTEKLRLNIQKQLPVKMAEHDLVTLGPQRTLKNLESGQYEGLQDEDKLSLLARATSEWHRQIAEQKLKEAQGQNAIAPWDTNPIVWGNIFFGIQKGSVTVEGKEVPLTGDQWVAVIHDAFERHQLSIEHTKQLEAMVAGGTFQDIWFKQTEKLFKDSFGWQEAFQTFADPSAIQPHHQAMAELLSAIQNEGLRGPAIWNRGLEILKPHLAQYGQDQAKVSTEKEGMNIPQWIRSKTIIPLGEKWGIPWWIVSNKPYEEKKREAQPAPTGPQRQPGETPAQYEQRMKQQ
jgi:hypothetical protein